MINRYDTNSTDWQNRDCVDEVIFSPIDEDELSIRVKNLLRWRSQTRFGNGQVTTFKKTQETRAESPQAFLSGEIASEIPKINTTTSWNVLKNFVADIQGYAIFMLDAHGKVTSWNAETQRIMGYTAAEIIGQHFSKFYPETDRFANKPDLELQLVMTAGQCEDEGWRLRSSGLKFWAKNTIYAVYDDSGSGSAAVHQPREDKKTLPVIGFSVIIHDLSDRQEIEEELCLLNRSLRTIWECSQAMVRASAESELLDEICRIIVEIGKYPLAWIGVPETDTTVTPISCAGIELKYIESLNLTWEDPSPDFHSISGDISKGKLYICQDILTDPNFGPWRDLAREQGYVSCICLPLISRPISQDQLPNKDPIPGESFGVLTIFAIEGPWVLTIRKLNCCKNWPMI